MNFTSSGFSLPAPFDFPISDDEDFERRPTKCIPRSRANLASSHGAKRRARTAARNPSGPARSSCSSETSATLRKALKNNFFGLSLKKCC
jgi:hypothetical protein